MSSGGLKALNTEKPPKSLSGQRLDSNRRLTAHSNSTYVPHQVIALSQKLWLLRQTYASSEAFNLVAKLIWNKCSHGVL